MALAATDVAYTDLEDMLREIEARLRRAPDLGVELGAGLSNPTTMPNPRAAVSAFVRREFTRNLGETRNKDQSRVEDTVTVELLVRVNPKDQLASRKVAHDLEDSVRNRLTDLTFQRKWNAAHLDTREQVRGEWLSVFLRFLFKRFETVGRG